MAISAHQIATASDDQLFELLETELDSRLPSRTDPEFLDAIRKLPPGLRAMAATYELDVSLCLDDFGWHFGNWHDQELAEETAAGLEVLGAVELAALFREAFEHAKRHWDYLGEDGWADRYHASELQTAVMPLNKRAWALLEPRWNRSIFSYWIEYAREHPEGIGASHDA